MTRDEAIALIGRRLGYASTTDIEALIIAELKLAQTTLENDPRIARPWFLITSVTDLTTTASTYTVSLPSDFLAEHEEGGLWYYLATSEDNPYKELRKDKLDYCLRYYGSEDAGEPSAYALSGSQLWIFPLPAAAYTLKFQYYASDTELSTNVENDWLKYAPDLLVAEAGLLVAQDLEHGNGIRVFTQLRNEARARFNAYNESRIHDQMSYTMGT